MGFVLPAAGAHEADGAGRVATKTDDNSFATFAARYHDPAFTDPAHESAADTTAFDLAEGFAGGAGGAAMAAAFAVARSIIPIAVLPVTAAMATIPAVLIADFKGKSAVLQRDR